jgi:hypothetical protein
MVIQNLEYSEVIVASEETNAIQGSWSITQTNSVSQSIGTVGRSTNSAFGAGTNRVGASIRSGTSSIAFNGNLFFTSAFGTATAIAI